MNRRIVIVGGGINGAGMARDAALRGFEVVLFEKGDFCSGTSWTSSKLIHGGLRYLEHFEFGLVRESLREREILLRIHTHNVKPLPFVLPLCDFSPHHAQTLRAGLTLYDLFSFDKSLPNHRTLSREEVIEAAPGLEQKGLGGGFLYYDCQCPFPERLVMSNLHSAVASGAAIFNYHAVISLIAEGDRITRVLVRNELTGDIREVSCDFVINAAGPWVDGVIGRTGTKLIGGTRGAHLVVKKFPGAPERAVYVNAKSDGRPLFILPWLDYLIIGTTDSRYDDDPDLVQVLPDEVAYLLAEANIFFPDAQLSSDDILFCMSGVRPLPHVPRGHAGGITRRHILVDHALRDGKVNMVSLIGGKLTTYRHTAEDVVDFVVKRMHVTAGSCETSEKPLWGSENVPEPSGSDDIFTALYGDKASDIRCLKDPGGELEPAMREITAQTRYAVRHEWARRPADVIWRRTSAGMGPKLGYDVLDQVAATMGSELGWSGAQVTEALADYSEFVSRRLKPPGLFRNTDGGLGGKS